MSDHERLALLRDVWREVSRHLEIGESISVLAERIARELPLTGLRIRRYEAEGTRLDTAAAWGVLLGDSGRSVLTTSRALESWTRRGRVAAEPSLVDVAPEVSVLVGPLLRDGALVGAAVFAGELGAHTVLLDALLEPFATALANDRRLHELARLKEAAEADRTALLQRLGRQDIADTVVGADGGLRAVMARVEQVARTDAPVLVLGETGAGKEVVARQLHTRSIRARGPFLRVNCGAIPPDLVDSELFGHEKGAFTGAVAQRKGWFERADGGTLFLDEIGELPAAAQVRLLRVLQDGTFQRVGGHATNSVDVRIVAATHRNLPTLVRDGRFRHDLWYRVSVFPIELPALRDRKDDIPALAAHFAERAGERLFGVPLRLSAQDIQALQAYPWPGNVRELASVIERAAILGDGKGLAIVASLGVLPAARPPSGDDPDAIRQALERSHGRVEGPFGAAAALGVNANTLRSRMRKLGIDRAEFRTRS
jgi:hydrogenase-4 transcriptional activator